VVARSLVRFVGASRERGYLRALSSRTVGLFCQASWRRRRGWKLPTRNPSSTPTLTVHIGLDRGWPCRYLAVATAARVLAYGRYDARVYLRALALPHNLRPPRTEWNLVTANHNIRPAWGIPTRQLRNLHLPTAASASEHLLLRPPSPLTVEGGWSASS